MGNQLIPVIKALTAPLSDCSKYVLNSMHIHSKCCGCECELDTDSVDLQSEHSETSVDCCGVHGREKH